MTTNSTFAKHRNIRKIAQNLNSANFANNRVFLLSLNSNLTVVWTPILLGGNPAIVGHKSPRIRSQYSQNNPTGNIANFADVNMVITMILFETGNQNTVNIACFQTRGGENTFAIFAK